MDSIVKKEFQEALLKLCRGAYLEGSEDFNCTLNTRKFNFEKSETYKIILNMQTPQEKLVKLLSSNVGKE